MGQVEVVYEYELDRTWEHRMVFLGKAESKAKLALGVPENQPVVCFSGEGHPAAEDCRGPRGWDDLKELLAKPEKEDPEDRRGWYKYQCRNGERSGKWNPYAWDIGAVNAELKKKFGKDYL